jgi:hypothetical protein
MRGGGSAREDGGFKPGRGYVMGDGKRARAALLAVVGAVLMAAPVGAMAQSIAGVWRSQVQGTPSGMTGQVTSSDVQTLTLTADGRYQRQITVEGGNGVIGAAGMHGGWVPAGPAG